MRSFSAGERRARLAHRQFLCGEDQGTSLEAMTAALIGWHATDPATPYLSLWARKPGFMVGDLEYALYEARSVVKHLAMRRTLWLFHAHYLPMVQPGASDRVADNERRRLVADVQKAGVEKDGNRWLDAAGAAVLSYLDQHGPANSADLRKALPELAGTWDPAPGKRWGGDTPLAPRVLTVLSVRGDIVRGPNVGKWTVSRPLWASTADWLGIVEGSLPPEHARAELIRTWLATFGPALTDIKWWFGSTLTWVRQGLSAIDAVEVDMDGAPGYALPDDLEPVSQAPPWCALLPGLDVTTMGWFDRDWYLGGHRSRVFDTYGNAGPTAWWNGRVVGSWAQDAAGRVHVQLLEDPGRDGRKALSRKSTDLTAWLDGVRINPRFPSPLSKAGVAPPSV